MLNTAIILAGGYGTRLQSVVHDVPKPMAPIGGLPFLNYQLKFLKYHGINSVILSVGHLASIIKDHYKTSFEGIHIQYATEEKPMGTGGGIRLACEKSSENNVLVLNGDSFFDIDLKIFFQLHTQHKAQVSLALRRVNDASRYGTITLGQNNQITSFTEKGGTSQEGLISAGIYILDRDVYLRSTVPGTSFSIERDFFEKQSKHLSIKGFEFEGYFIDIGIPSDYEKAQHDFKGFKY